MLAEDGPALSAFIVDNSTNITAEAVSRLLEYADQGFAVLFVGGLPQTSPYYSSAATEAYIKQGVLDLLSYPTVRNLSSEAEVVLALQDLGISPAASNLSPCPILYTHRYDADDHVDYYWAYNSDLNNSHATQASLRGSGVPFILDAWTGTISPVLNYTLESDRTTLWLELRSNQSTIIALAPEDFFPGISIPSVHVTSSSNVSSLHLSPDGSSLIARSYVSARQATLSLSDGRNLTLRAPRPATATVPAAEIKLGPWHLTVQDWLPNPAPWTNYSSVFAYHYVVLDELVPWYNISGLEDVSGVGTYVTEFMWPLESSGLANSSAGNISSVSGEAGQRVAGALLDLGPVLNTVRLWVNGEWTGPVDVWDAVVDIGQYLVNGTNEVRVETSSTLRNRLLQANVTQSWEQAQYSETYGPRPYGLVGPVTLKPYWETVIPL